MAKTATKKDAPSPPPAGGAEHPQGAAVGAEAAQTPAPPQKVIHIPAHLRHDQIVPDPDNARTDFDEAELKGLADTLFSAGMKQPVRCLPANAECKWQLFMGERRWRAWGRLVADGRWAADHTELVLVEAADELTRLEAGLIENLQRVNLNHMEAGLGFEKLATRCSRSNKEIAEAIGRTPEFVQQHRRLAQLDAGDQQAMREGRISMHDALRILSQPKPLSFEDLKPAEQLVLAEAVDHIRRNPGKGYYSDRSECSYLAAGDKAMKALREQNLLSLDEKDWQTKKCFISFGYQARRLLGADPLNVMGPEGGAKAIRRLRELRLAASGYNPLSKNPGPAPQIQDKPYTTAWLNGPFELSPAAAKELANEKAKKARDREAGKIEKAKREAFCAEAITLGEKLLPVCTTPIDTALPDLFRRSRIKLPVAVKGRRIVDAAGEACLDPNWRFGDQGEAVLLAVALAINAATGWGKTQPPAEDFRRALDLESYIDVVAINLIERDPAFEDARKLPADGANDIAMDEAKAKARRFLDAQCAKHERPFGAEGADWSEASAMRLAGAIAEGRITDPWADDPAFSPKLKALAGVPAAAETVEA